MMQNEDIYTDDRQSDSIKLWKYIAKQDRPDICIAKILNLLDHWYDIGYNQGINDLSRCVNILIGHNSDDFLKKIDDGKKSGPIPTPKAKEVLDKILKDAGIT